jgi:CRISPR/Cas system CSM-associated protein Csm3 (group 7 of RAMP superfamily)
MMVRARDAESLQDLADLSGEKIKSTPTGDYPYRVVVTDSILTEWMSRSIEIADYTNFKSRVAVSRGHGFADALMLVWSVMHDVEDSNARLGLAVR